MTRSIWLVRKKKKYLREGEYVREDFYYYREKAERIKEDLNFEDAKSHDNAEWLRKNGWLTTNSPNRPEAMDKIRRMSEGAWEVIERRVDDRFQ